MSGSLPRNYQVAIWTTGLSTFVCLGVVASHAVAALLWPSGAMVGALFGVLAVAAFVHLLSPRKAPITD